MKGHRLSVGILLFVVASLISIQVWVSWKNKQLVVQTLNELEKTRTDEASESFSDNKTREEVIALRIENKKKSVFLYSFITSFGTAISIIVAFVGGYIAFSQFVDEKKKEKSEKFGGILNELWKGVMSDDINIRAGSIAGLQQFLNEENEPFHERVGLALSLAGRRSDNDNLMVLRTLTLVVEKAFINYPKAMQKISWQGLKLYRPDFSKCELDDFDLRDCVLTEAKFCNAIIRHGKLNAANLKGSDFSGADLRFANLEYADLALTNFTGADLRNANLYNTMIVDMDLKETKLQGALFSHHLMDWILIKNWRDAHYDPHVDEYHKQTFPPQASGPKILILIWEYPPLVAGGAWTATYHLVKNLREKGCDITIIVPWLQKQIDHKLFGNEISLYGVGKESAGKNTIYSPYQNTIYSPYDSNINSEKQNIYSSYDNYFSSYDQQDDVNTYLKSSSIFQKINEFKKNTLECILKENLRFDLIHAVDWITFETAKFISDQQSINWVAHFHSIEYERHNKISNSIRTIEYKASLDASRILVPSSVSKENLIKEYQVPQQQVVVAHNCLSKEQADPLTTGEYESKIIAFVGRITWQKGPDIFLQIAYELRQLNEAFRFEMYGSSDKQMDRMIDGLNYRDGKIAERKGFVNWYERNKIFENLSAIIVPSRYEPFGMIVLEAMQYGVPVFFAETAGVSEVISSGVHFNINDDPKALAEKINGIVKDKKKWKTIMEKQCEEMKDYSRRGYENDILNVWKELISIEKQEQPV